MIEYKFRLFSTSPSTTGGLRIVKPWRHWVLGRARGRTRQPETTEIYLDDDLLGANPFYTEKNFFRLFGVPRQTFSRIHHELKEKKQDYCGT